MALAPLLSLFHHAHHHWGCTLWNTGEKWNLENGQTKDWPGGVRQITFGLRSFTTLITAMFQVGSNEKQNPAFSGV